MPGVVFAIQIDNQRPARDPSTLRELTTIGAIGALCDLICLVLFSAIRAIFPRNTPDVGKILRLGFPYFKVHAVSEFWWIVGLVIFSCGLAYALGRFQPRVAGAIASGDIAFNSAWWELFHTNPTSRMYVGCELQDGSYIGGYLFRYSSEIDETQDRDLALVEPIKYRPVGKQDAELLKNVGTVSLSASQIKFLAVTYEQAGGSQTSP